MEFSVYIAGLIISYDIVVGSHHRWPINGYFMRIQYVCVCIQCNNYCKEMTKNLSMIITFLGARSRIVGIQIYFPIFRGIIAYLCITR